MKKASKPNRKKAARAQQYPYLQKVSTKGKPSAGKTFMFCN